MHLLLRDAMNMPVWKCQGCGCLWRDNLDDTVSLLDAEQKSCSVCEHAPTREACSIHWLSIAAESAFAAKTEPHAALQRWGVSLENPFQLHALMSDGYWTPWHIAQSQLEAAEARADAAEHANERRYELWAAAADERDTLRTQLAASEQARAEAERQERDQRQAANHWFAEANDKHNRYVKLEAAFDDYRIEAEQRVRWHPIATAPKDGIEVLLTDGSWKRTGYWAKRIAVWSVDSAVPMKPPTHWMPLPAALESAMSVPARLTTVEEGKAERLRDSISSSCEQRVRALTAQWRGQYEQAISYDRLHGLRDTTTELGGKAIAADELDAALASEQTP